MATDLFTRTRCINPKTKPVAMCEKYDGLSDEKDIVEGSAGD